MVVDSHVGGKAMSSMWAARWCGCRWADCGPAMGWRRWSAVLLRHNNGDAIWGIRPLFFNLNLKICNRRCDRHPVTKYFLKILKTDRVATGCAAAKI